MVLDIRGKTGQLWLDLLRPPPGFTLSSTVLTRVDAEALRARAPGEVKRPESINFRTLLPVRDGLFCDRIFGEGPLERGPFADDELVLDPRATRFGRIVLPIPMVHPLALAHAPEEVAERARLARDEDGEAILLHELPVLPPYLRPMKQLGDGGWATSDITELYRRVINRATRLRRLRELEAPVVIVANEHNMLAQALHTLFENEDCPQPMTGPDGRILASLRTLGIGNRLFEALAELDRRAALGVPIDGPLPRTLHHPIAALYAMGLALH